MSNSLKIKSHKKKEKNTDKSSEVSDSKHGANFLKNKREKGTVVSNFAGKTSKEFSRKKT